MSPRDRAGATASDAHGVALPPEPGSATGTDAPVFAPGPLDAWPDDSDEVLLTQVEFAERIKRTARQIHNLVELGLPIVMRGDQRYYPWPRGLHWVIERRVEERVRKEMGKRVSFAAPAASAAGSGSGMLPGTEITEDEILAAKARRLLAEAVEAEAKAEKAVLAVQKERSEVVSVAFMAQALEDHLRPLRAALQNIPGRWQVQFVGLPDERAARAKLEHLARDTGRLLVATTTSTGATAAADPATPIGADDTRVAVDAVRSAPPPPRPLASTGVPRPAKPSETPTRKAAGKGTTAAPNAPPKAAPKTAPKPAPKARRSRRDA